MKCDIYGGTGSDEDNRITVRADKKVSNGNLYRYSLYGSFSF